MLYSTFHSENFQNKIYWNSVRQISYCFIWHWYTLYLNVWIGWSLLSLNQKMLLIVLVPLMLPTNNPWLVLPECVVGEWRKIVPVFNRIVINFKGKHQLSSMMRWKIVPAFNRIVITSKEDINYLAWCVGKFAPVYCYSICKPSQSITIFPLEVLWLQAKLSIGVTLF